MAVSEKRFYRFICVKCRISVCQLSEPHKDAMKVNRPWWANLLAFIFGITDDPEYICDKCLNASIMDA
jgi:hypothetical protein